MTWTAAHEAALVAARDRATQPAAPPDGPRLSRAQIAQRARRAREDARNPPSPEVLARRAYKAAHRVKADPTEVREQASRKETP